MDGTRLPDIERLQMVIQDPKESVAHKRQALRALTRIREQGHDVKLRDLRLRLIRATQAEDPEAAEKISDELQDYQLRTYGR